MTTDNLAERRRYNLLKALQETDPQCQILKDEIVPIEESHNWDWRDPLLPGFIVGELKVVSEDSFATSTLRNTTAEDFVTLLIQSQRQNQIANLIPPLPSVQEVTRQYFEWGTEVAQELERRQHWSNPVWKDIISGWSNADLQPEQHRQILTWFSKSGVYSHHAGAVAESLHAMVRNGGKAYAPDLIDEAEQVALPLWDNLHCDDRMPVQGWHEAAFSYYQIGHLTRFWLDATAIRARTSAVTAFSPTCIRGLGQIVGDDSLKGDIGTAVLAGQTDFLLQIQQPWTEANIQPMFTCGGNRERAAWGGLVEAKNISRQVAQSIGPTFQEKFGDLTEQPGNEPFTQKLFADAYTKLLCHYAPDPEKWLKETIKKCTSDTAALVAQAMQNRLREADPEQQKDWWDRWIFQYWRDRNMGAPLSISPAEGSRMIGWTPHLTESFPEAVELAKETPWEGPSTQLFIELSRSSAVSKFPDTAAELLINWGEKSTVSTDWGDGLEILDKIEQAHLSEQTIENIADLKAQIRDIVSSSR